MLLIVPTGRSVVARQRFNADQDPASDPVPALKLSQGFTDKFKVYIIGLRQDFLKHV
jgi:hypothetical protein